MISRCATVKQVISSCSSRVSLILLQTLETVAKGVGDDLSDDDAASQGLSLLSFLFPLSLYFSLSLCVCICVKHLPCSVSMDEADAEDSDEGNPEAYKRKLEEYFDELYERYKEEKELREGKKKARSHRVYTKTSNVIVYRSVEEEEEGGGRPRRGAARRGCR